MGFRLGLAGLAGRFGFRLGFGLGFCLGCGLALGLLTRVADHRQVAANLDGVVLLGDDLGQHAGGGRRDFGVDLVGRHLDQRLVELDRIAFLLEPARDRSLGDALTEGRHLHGEGHLY
ncbi:hypothetical protein A5736_02335 [Mycobacterium sp. SP-6446]|nr:hypothetical protein A5736_02335 [Mycobacterium sp. SP-6446]